ncbi:MAG: hydrogenase maturation protease [Candidatus Jettenia sp.]|uniref:Hydrogenase maturation protease n=2 Tax=Candidatus Jettenia TaxID=360731 RepID=I3IGK0_9BACT|nr:MAG: hydrogenase maturation protease [Candidatus Jettenia sp. AMX1]MBC6929804.1 hydrogenase maturation protease [Candidatus Jettenia sp.]NUN22548.1 hydrogenase maturation protease [Candidatus Jettenia caeni]MCE7881381.1 hydrogenase maturation protease [Candidatus Jettenia sp. AMX1]MCQ3927962.1 hydrogenase maturation protease [Candidatus Jettenia sp.]
MYRGDDAVGLATARHLKKHVPDYVSVLEGSGNGVAFMESWKNADTVILIDAVHSGTKPGTIHRFDASAHPLPSEFFRYSTHTFGVAEIIELARTLNQLPSHLIVYGIEGKRFEAGIGISPEVNTAVQEVVNRLRQDIHSFLKVS